MSAIPFPLGLREVALELVTQDTTPRQASSMHHRRAPLAAPSEQLRQLATVPLERNGQRVEFDAVVGHALKPDRLEIFQVNLGKLCNMTCRHCHVDAGPDRTDAMMSDEVVEQVIAAIRRSQAHTVDITGGAPELHPRFRDVVEASVGSGKHVMDRCNLTVLLLRRHVGLIDWLARHGVEVVASLPHYRRPNTDAQRGDGAYERSIEALRQLNAAGYGQGDPRRRLSLVSNPAGAFLGASQASVEREWREALQRNFGTYVAEVARFEGESAARLTATGGVGFLGGHAFASREISESFGIVRVDDYPGVGILLDNQLAGRTNADGYAVLPQLRAYDVNRISIDQRDLPLDAKVDRLRIDAVPYYRSGVLAEFPIRRSRGATFTIRLDDGSLLPAGAKLKVIGRDDEYPVGLNGLAYVTGLERENRVRGSWRGRICEFDVPVPPTTDPLPDLGTFVCRGMQ